MARKCFGFAVMKLGSSEFALFSDDMVAMHRISRIAKSKGDGTLLVWLGDDKDPTPFELAPKETMDELWAIKGVVATWVYRSDLVEAE